MSNCYELALTSGLNNMNCLDKKNCNNYKVKYEANYSEIMTHTMLLSKIVYNPLHIIEMKSSKVLFTVDPR